MSLWRWCISFINGQTNTLMMEKHSFQREVTKAVYVELVQQFRNADVAWMERVERFASGGQTMEDSAALDNYSMERGDRINPQADPFQFIFSCATRKLCNMLSIEANKRLFRITFNSFDIRGGACHCNNKGCLLSACLGQKVHFNETRTETNKAMGVVIGFMGKKETQPEASHRMKENA